MAAEVTALASLLAMGAPREHPRLFLAALAAAVVAYLAALGPGWDGGSTAARVLLVAVALRAVLLPLAPSLSTDVWRYLWDGRVAAHGLNPYVEPPESPALAPLRDRLWSRVEHQEVPTVYPPLAMAGFSIVSRLPAPVLAWKTLLALADLATCWLLIRLCRRRGWPLRRAAAYAWHPLPALELAGMGHVDGLALPAVAGALLLLPSAGSAGSRGRTAWAGVTAAAGILAKLGPLVALPMWARQSRRPLLFLVAALGTTAVAVAPVVATAGVPRGLLVYAGSWEHAGPLYEPLARGLAAAGVAEGIKGGLAAVEDATERWQMFDAVYPWIYPGMLARGLLGAAALAWVLASWRQREPIAGTRRLFGGLLLLAPTVYPWYLLWVLPWAALGAHRAWLVAGCSSLLLYLPTLGLAPLWPWAWLAAWIPPLLVAIGTRWTRR